MMRANWRYPRLASPIGLVCLLAACGDGPTAPRQPGLRFVLGAGITDTVDAQPLQALVVEVRGTGGALTRGAVVRFQAQPVEETTEPFIYQPRLYVCALTAPDCGGFGGGQFATDITDANGRAKVSVRMGQLAGPTVVRVTVPELGLADSANFTVMPGAGVDVRALAADTTLDIGATATLRGHVVDRYGNRRTELTTTTAGPGSALTLNAATATVTGTDMGTQWVFTRFGSFVDSIRVGVVPSGRLLVWSSDERVVRLVNVNGSGVSTVVSNVSSDLGAFPKFDPSRQRVTLHAGSQSYGGPPNNLIVIDTTGSQRRTIGPDIGFSMIMATRQLANGTVLVVGQRSLDPSHPGYSLWSVATDNTITFLAALPGLESTYGGADISHAGTRVAYISSGPTPEPGLRVLDVSNGSSILLETGGFSPRWSAQDDRIAYLVQASGYYYQFDGVAVVINADGTGRRGLGSATFTPGLGWSPDGKYVVGRSYGPVGLHLIRVSDGANVLLRFRSAYECCPRDYWQPDWR